MHRTRIHFVLTLLVTFLVHRGTRAQSSDMDSAVVWLVDQQYARASEKLHALLSQNPDNLDALYMLLANRQTRILDYESYTIEGEEYYRYADSVMEVMERKIGSLRGSDSLRCLFYIGNILGGKSIMLAKNEKWLPAIPFAYQSVSILKEVTKKDPSFHAAYLGTGVFDFYLSKSLKWIPTFGNKEQSGIAQIKKATTAPFPYNLVAKNSLCWILIEQGKLREADSIAATVTREFKENTIFLRIRALIAMYRHDWDQAEILSTRLISLSKSRHPVNWSDMTCGYRVLVSAHHGRGRKDQAIHEAREAFALKIPDRFRSIPYIRDHLAQVEAIVTSYEPSGDK